MGRLCQMTPAPGGSCLPIRNAGWPRPLPRGTIHGHLMARQNNHNNEGRQRQEEKYERILQAALQVFAAKGFHEARISEIARAAGVADGTIYLYFKNKDDILLSLF